MTASNGDSSNFAASNGSIGQTLTDAEADAAINSFCEYLRFETVSRTAEESGAYSACGAWLLEYIKDVVDESFLLEEAPKSSPVVVGCWKGRDDNLPIVLLNSHYDVVPAVLEEWTVPPFDAVRKDGKIYGRGTQDMKCVSIQYVEAIRKIRKMNPEYQPERSIYLTFVPDEEVGGGGMAALLDSEFYRSLPGIAIALDEGLASTTETMSVFYGERMPWFINVTALGPTGHGSRFIEQTAVEQVVELCNKALAFRQGQRDLLGVSDHENCSHAVAAANQKKKKTLGDVTSLNITMLQAGVKVGNTYAHNCVPPKAELGLDIRISPHTEPSEISDMLDTWCRECTKNEKLPMKWKQNHARNLEKHNMTSTDPEQNPWYAVFESTLEEMQIEIEPQVFPAATDSRFLRALGIRALGFSPMRSTEILLHENDEYIPQHTFVEGIGIYVKVIQAFGSQGKEIEAKE